MLIYKLSFESLIKTVAIMSFGGLLLPANAWSQDTSKNDKGIQVQPANSTRADNAEAFEFVVEIEKTEFETDEPVSFKVEGSRDFFLYVFSEDLDTGEKTLLLPNARQTYNAYQAGRSFTVPDSTVTYTRSQPGKERITAVATTELMAINLEELEKKGDFFSGEDTVLDASVNAKGIVISQTGGAGNSDSMQMYNAELTFVARKPVMSSLMPDSPDSPVVMTSTSCAVCKVGDPMKLAFSSDQEGVITLLLIEPGGKQTTLLSEKVEADDIYYVSAVAEAPMGEHALIALYGSDADAVADAVKNVFPIDRLPSSDNGDETAGKGVRLTSKPEALLPHSVRQFVIVD